MTRLENEIKTAAVKFFTGILTIVNSNLQVAIERNYPNFCPYFETKGGKTF